MTGIVILAAGASSRLGHPKQKLLFQNKTLLQHAATEALAIEDGPVVVVLGANAQTILPDIETLNVHPVVNPEWEEGMGASIRAGVKALLTLHPNLSAVMIMLCDQPFVDAKVLKGLIRCLKREGRSIVACSYKEALGPPVLFSQRYFPELLSLSGKEGARTLLSKYKDAVGVLPFEKGSIDIDTAADYENLKNK